MPLISCKRSFIGYIEVYKDCINTIQCQILIQYQLLISLGKNVGMIIAIVIV